MDKLSRAFVAIFGIGGVGSYAAEALARCGVGGLALFDDDSVCLTNINRQIIASHITVGRLKVEVMRERILDIQPKCAVEIYPCFYTAYNASQYDLARYTYIIDAIDTVSSKLVLIEKAAQAQVPIISSMGMGNKLDPLRLEVADIYATSVCPLARVMRKELRIRGIMSLKVVYSREEIIQPVKDVNLNCRYHCICPPGTRRSCTVRRQVPGSIAFVPAAAGLILASQVVRDLIGS